MLVLFAAALHASAALTFAGEPRTALVMGVWDYGESDTFPSLPGVDNDLPAMGAKLRELGFEVTTVANPTLAQAEKAVDDFGARLRGRGGVGLYYFSGHGAEFEGTNYLLPKNARVNSNRDLRDQALSANRVLNRMEESGAPVNLVFLDCCRNALTKSAGSGLAPMQASGVFVGFATASQKVAQASTEGSLYTRALVKHLGTQGLSITDMHTLVTATVLTESRVPGAIPGQTPFQYSGLNTLFYLRPEPTSRPALQMTPAPRPPMEVAKLEVAKPAPLPPATPAPARPATPDASAGSPTRPAPLPATDGINPPIATVDMKKLFESYKKTKDAESDINADRNAAKTELENLMASYQKLLDDVNKMSGAERDAAIAKLRAMETRITDFRTTRETELQEKSVRLRAGIVADINNAIAATPALSAATFVLDASGPSLNGLPVVLYSSPILDQSGEVLKRLGREKGGGAADSNAGRGLGIAALDMKRIFESYYKTKDAEDRINEARNAARLELEDRMATAKRELGAVTKLDEQLAGTGLSAKVRSAKEKERATKAAELQTMDKDIKDFQANREKQLQEQSLRMRAGIVDDINQVINEGVKAEGRVDLIFDSSGPSLNGTPIVLHLDGIPDWTDSVITTLNSRKPGGKKASIGRGNGSVSTSGLRFAVVDMKRVFETLPSTKAAEKAINDAREKAKSDVAAGADSKAKEKELQELSVRKRNEIVDKMNKLLFDRASKSGYHVVFDSSGNSLNGVPVVTMRKAVPDLSNEIITALGGKVE